MAITYTLTSALSRSGGVPTAVTLAQSADGETIVDVALTADTADQAITFACNYASIKAILIKVSENMTLKTNSTSTPGDQYTISSAVPFIWFSDSGLANPFDTNITSLYVSTNVVGGANPTFYMAVLRDV